MKCVFCDIVSSALAAEIIWASEDALAFLDHKPLFPGHVLLIPREHAVTLADLPVTRLQGFFEAAQRIERAIEKALGAEGTFIAINNRVSQSVPHLHVHLVPRTRGDGLKGFFWPRRAYESTEHLQQTAAKLREALAG